MAQYFKQLRYYGEGSDYNNVTKEALVNGTAFNNYIPLTQIGIRALPGTRIYLNGNSKPIIIGFIGIFELDCRNNSNITEIKVSEASLDRIKNTPQGGYIIIDMLGSKGGS